VDDLTFVAEEYARQVAKGTPTWVAEPDGWSNPAYWAAMDALLLRNLTEAMKASPLRRLLKPEDGDGGP
jgi:hypothetical protein